MTGFILPSPQDLGLPAKYTKWRKHQPDAIRVIDESENPTTILMLPPGAGKSVIYMAWAVWRKQRVAILTPNHFLQNQLGRDFASLGIMDIRGQANYTCEVTGGTVDVAPCHGGMPCPLKTTTCEYFAKIRRAKNEQIVITNPAFWFHNKSVLGRFDALIVDECHSIFDQLSNHVSISFSKRDVAKYFHRQPILDWPAWASYQNTIFEGELRNLKATFPKTDEVYDRIRIIKRFQEKTEVLKTADPNTLIMEKTVRGWRWECVWPGAYRHLLTGTANRYILTSGTVVPRTASMLGYRKGDYTWAEYPSTFPVKRRPVYILPAPRMNASCGPGEMRLWLNLIDLFLDTRVGWKGIIHSGSYARSEYLVLNSRHADRFIAHFNSKGTVEAVRRFEESVDGILVSPSLTEGVDFPYELCTFVIIAKIPFGDHRQPVLAERLRQDPEFGLYSAALSIVQASARGMRAKDDYCETAIVDGSWQHWFWHRARHHFPSYFREATTICSVVPKGETKIATIFKQKA